MHTYTDARQPIYCEHVNRVRSLSSCRQPPTNTFMQATNATCVGSCWISPRADQTIHSIVKRQRT